MHDISIRLGDVIQVRKYIDDYFYLGRRFIVQGITKRPAYTEYQVIEEESRYLDEEITIEPWFIGCFEIVKHA
jgi:hypothetical protein